MKKHFFAILLILFLSYWSIDAFFNNGYFPMHDDTQIGRVIGMGKALRNGQFPVRWISDLGYGFGYPIFNFYAPLPYYFGGFLYFLGLTGLAATKIMMLIGIPLAGISMYFFSYYFLGSIGAIIAAIFYIYAPYHAVQIYVRGAVGESWTLIFIPILLLGVFKLIQRSKQALLLGGVGLAGIILSHTVIGYVSLFFFAFGILTHIAYCKIKSKQDIYFYELILILLCGLGLSGFFWLPAITEMKFTSVYRQIGPTADFKDHFVCLNQLWDSAWGYGGSIPGCVDGLSFKLGKLHLIIALVALSLSFWKRRVIHTGFISIILLITSVAIFLNLQISRPVWQMLPNFQYVQYPWRFLTISIFGLSVLSGYIVFISKNKYIRLFIACIVILFIIVFNSKLFKPQYLYNRSIEDFESRLELRYRVSKVSDEYLPDDFLRPKTEKDIAFDTISTNSEAQSEVEIDTETYVKYFVTVSSNKQININRIYFPGWEYWINGKKVNPIVEHGLPSLLLTEGKNVVEMHFNNTLIRLFSNFISVATILLLIYYYGKKTIS